MVTTLLAVVVCGLAAAEGVEAPPPAIPDFSAVVADETALVDAIRAFDLEQQELAQGDFVQATERASEGDEARAAELRRQARARYALIGQAYETALERYPNSARANNYYGEVLYDYLGQGAKALQVWKLAAMLDPKLGRVRNNLGIHYCHVGQYELGLKSFEEALKLEPDNPDYLFNVAQIYLAHFPAVQERYRWKPKRIYREAMKYSKKAAALDPTNYENLEDYAVNFYAAENFGVKADWAEAAAAWARARECSRNDTERFYTWLNEARAWIRKPDPKKAAQCLREALAIYPESPVAQRLLDGLEVDGA